MQGTGTAALKPSTVETIREQLEFHRWHDPILTEYHFPKIAERGTPVEYGDILAMSDQEADSVRHLLVNDLRYARRRCNGQMARSVSLLSDDDAGYANEWSARAMQLAEALVDLCAVRGLPDPM